MPEFIKTLVVADIAGFVYKTLAILVGFGFAYLGYRLLQLEANRGGNQEGQHGLMEMRFSGLLSVLAKGFRDGTLFALFGMIVVTVCLLRPAQFMVEIPQGENVNTNDLDTATEGIVLEEFHKPQSEGDAPTAAVTPAPAKEPKQVGTSES